VYGVDLDKLKEGERIGVMRTSEVSDCEPWMCRYTDSEVVRMWTGSLYGPVALMVLDLRPLLLSYMLRKDRLMLIMFLCQYCSYNFWTCW
jgi:hypothetical protein